MHQCPFCETLITYSLREVLRCPRCRAFISGCSVEDEFEEIQDLLGHVYNLPDDNKLNFSWRGDVERDPETGIRIPINAIVRAMGVDPENVEVRVLSHVDELLPPQDDLDANIHGEETFGADLWYAAHPVSIVCIRVVKGDAGSQGVIRCPACLRWLGYDDVDISDIRRCECGVAYAITTSTELVERLNALYKVIVELTSGGDTLAYDAEWYRRVVRGERRNVLLEEGIEALGVNPAEFEVWFFPRVDYSTSFRMAPDGISSDLPPEVDPDALPISFLVALKN